jgi:hypothetical protein
MNTRRCSNLDYVYFCGRHEPKKKLEGRITPKYIFKQVVVVIVVVKMAANLL